MCSNLSSLSIEDAQQLLEKFTCNTNSGIISEQEKTTIRAALLKLTEASEYQMLGICADSLSEAMTALKSYLTTLSYEKIPEEESLTPVEGSVYLKFNGRVQNCYVSSYTEQYRGVLISYQSTDDGGINGTYGHFPLDLFA